MAVLFFVRKFRKRIWWEIVQRTRSKSYYFKFYKSYWHSKYYHIDFGSDKGQYFAAIPNEGAGIGHQLANWIAGYWFAKQFNIPFAHIPFSSEEWEKFFALGTGEVLVNDLIYNKKFKKVLLPLFDENKSKDIELIKKIINSYKNKSVVFICEQDQFYKDQFGVMKELKMKFHNSKARKEDKLFFNEDDFNIAIHVRRGDIVAANNKNNNLTMRFQETAYFEKVLSSVISDIKTKKNISIYLFSQGERIDFPEFEKFDNINFCLEITAQDSFLHMVMADLLVTSKSSFSYKPALFSYGIKVCPVNFWHGYPKTNDWVLVDDMGNFDTNKLKQLTFK